MNFPSNNKPSYCVTTNSTLIDDNFINFANNNNLKITFSIDGNIDGNLDVIWENRILINGNNSSKQIIKNTKKYADLVRINQVITSKSSKDFFNKF